MTITDLTLGYVAITRGDSEARWNWCKVLSDTLDATADKDARTAASIEIGKAVATAVGRDKPFAGSWVRNHVNAYKAFPELPETTEQRYAFLQAVNGNQDKAEKSAKTPDPLAQIRTAIKHALTSGIDAAAIQKAVADALKP